MLQKTYHYRWEWKLKSTPEALWPLATDTNRFNYDTGLPPLPGEPVTFHNARRRLSFRRLGILVEWEEEPFEWVRPFRFGVVRRYSSGPVKEMRVVCELQPSDSGGTDVCYQVWVKPRNLLGLIAIPGQIGLLSAYGFRNVFRRYDEQAHQQTLQIVPMTQRPHRLSGSAKQRLIQLRNTLVSQRADPDLLKLLTTTIEEGDDMTLARLRPYALADSWAQDRRAVLELFLQATRVGLLEFQWDLLCPLCRGAQETSASLGGIHTEVHCETCNIDFEVNFEQSVELTFRPNPAVREVTDAAYCIAGPQVTPHVVVQQLLPPHTEREIMPRLGIGRYRLRTLTRRGGQYLRVTKMGAAEAALTATPDDWPEEELALNEQPKLCLINATDEEQLFILEHLAWSDQAATAADVTALQRFRDLFSSEALRPGERVSIGSMTVVFTDLSGSTRLYNDVGDAPAFGIVMDHFDVLRKAIDGESGAIVKTIGDAVMAVFRKPAAALKAMVAAQYELSHREGRARRFLLKVGIHSGPCIAVTLNEKLDYFGSNINIAARLETQSTGQDIIISNALCTDPEVADWLAQPECDVFAEPFKATLKGFGDEEFILWRIRRRRPTSTIASLEAHSEKAL